MRWVYDDGGRAAAGFRGDDVGDCVTRSVAIATGMDYRDVYALVQDIGARRRNNPRMKGSTNARSGVHKDDCRTLMERIGGWTWTPTMAIGQGCTVHLCPDELPEGTLIVAVSKHWTCVVDGVIHDTHDPSRDETRCVYGYWRQTNGGTDDE